MTPSTKKSSTPSLLLEPDRKFGEQLHRIRDLHIEVESILQSLSALQNENVCASCTHVCCKEVICRESMDSDFLRFVLGSRAEDYVAHQGWYQPGSGCQLSYGRPLICYEFFCDRYDTPAVNTPSMQSLRQLSSALKRVYAGVYAGQHMLVVDDITRITAHKLNVIHDRLEKLKGLANHALRDALPLNAAVHAREDLANAPSVVEAP